MCEPAIEIMVQLLRRLEHVSLGHNPRFARVFSTLAVHMKYDNR